MIPTIPNFVFVISLALTTGYLTFLTTKGGLTDDRVKGAWRKLTKRGRLVFYVLIVISILLLGQEWNSQISSDRKDSDLKKQADKSDSIITSGITIGVEANRKRLFEDLSKALAKEGLKIDTLKDIIEKTPKTQKNVVNNFGQIDPVIAIDSNEIISTKTKDGLVRLSVTISSHDAGSTNHHISIFFIVQDTSGKRSFLGKYALPTTLQIAKERGWRTGFTIPNIDILYLYLKGNYSTLDGTKRYSVDNLYSFSVRTGEFALPQPNYKEEIIKLIPLKN